MSNKRQFRITYVFIDFDENYKILAALLDHLQIKKTYVMGISFGGAIALKLAIKQANSMILSKVEYHALDWTTYSIIWKWSPAASFKRKYGFSKKWN